MNNPTRRHFPTPQALSDWLKLRIPLDSFSLWGVAPGTKNVHNLWLELNEGETVLADSVPPIRTVNVLTLRVLGSENRVLIESGQDLSDGNFRTRNRPLSEKIRAGECPERAAYRAVREELGSVMRLMDWGNVGDVDNVVAGSKNVGSVDGVVRILPGSYKKVVEERNSVSYPGLPACYVLHCLDAVVEGLPGEDFCTDEGEEYGDDDGNSVADKAVSVKRHHWKWVSADSV